jgi:hypothetical protein
MECQKLIVTGPVVSTTEGPLLAEQAHTSIPKTTGKTAF